eukprot:768614-Hanusia_phi.AAC.2
MARRERKDLSTLMARRMRRIRRGEGGDPAGDDDDEVEEVPGVVEEDGGGEGGERDEELDREEEREEQVHAREEEVETASLSRSELSSSDGEDEAEEDDAGEEELKGLHVCPPPRSYLQLLVPRVSSLPLLALQRLAHACLELVYQLHALGLVLHAEAILQNNFTLSPPPRLSDLIVSALFYLLLSFPTSACFLLLLVFTPLQFLLASTHLSP